jgi:hypothetical protein
LVSLQYNEAILFLLNCLVCSGNSNLAQDLLDKKFSIAMKPEDLLLWLQRPTNKPYPEPFHIFTACLPKIHFNISHPCQGLHALFEPKISVHFSSSSCVWHVMDSSSCLTGKNIRQRIQITVWKSSLSSSFCSSVISPPLSHNILFGTLFSNTVNLFLQCVRTSFTTINSGHFIFPSSF